MRRQLLAALAFGIVASTGGCATLPAPTVTAEATPARAEDIDGRYRLVFELVSATWRAGQPIEGGAVLQLLAGDVADFSGSGGGPFGFRYVEVGGTRRMEPAWTADCASHQLRAERPLVTELTKSGGYSADDPDADFYRAFYSDPEVKLPAGAWDITAVATFTDGLGCEGRSINLEATIRVVVSN